MSIVNPPKPPPPKPPAAKPQIGAAPSKTFAVSRGRKIGPQKILIYGTGGIGKSELAENIKQCGARPLVIDLEGSAKHLDVARVESEDIQTFEDLRDVSKSESVVGDYDWLFYDSGTKAQELAEEYVVRNYKTDKGAVVSSLSEFHFGKGMEHTYDVWLLLMSDLDWNIRAGRNVVVVCHQCTEMVPNAAGEDYLQYQPRLQLPKSGKNSIRHRMIEWADHVFFIGYDKFVEDGKAKGSGSRAIYTAETPDCLAKSRTMPPDPIVYERGSADLWTRLFDSLKERT